MFSAGSLVVSDVVLRRNNSVLVAPVTPRYAALQNPWVGVLGLKKECSGGLGMRGCSGGNNGVRASLRGGNSACYITVFRGGKPSKEKMGGKKARRKAGKGSSKEGPDVGPPRRVKSGGSLQQGPNRRARAMRKIRDEDKDVMYWVLNLTSPEPTKSRRE